MFQSQHSATDEQVQRFLSGQDLAFAQEIAATKLNTLAALVNSDPVRTSDGSVVITCNEDIFTVRLQDDAREITYYLNTKSQPPKYIFQGDARLGDLENVIHCLDRRLEEGCDSLTVDGAQHELHRFMMQPDLETLSLDDVAPELVPLLDRLAQDTPEFAEEEERTLKDSLMRVLIDLDSLPALTAALMTRGLIDSHRGPNQSELRRLASEGFEPFSVTEIKQLLSNRFNLELAHHKIIEELFFGQGSSAWRPYRHLLPDSGGPPRDWLDSFGRGRETGGEIEDQ